MPPNNLDAEGAVLSAILNQPERLDEVVGLLKPEHFYSDANGRIFEAMTEVSTSGAAVDAVSVADWLRARELLQRIGGVPYMVQLRDAVPSYGNILTHAKIVHDLWRLRQLATACHRGAAGCYGDVGDVQAYVDDVEQSIYDLAHVSATSDAQPVGAVLTTVFQQLVALAESGGRISGLSTGFYDLDEMLAGLHPGDVTVVAARPGMGKTTKVLNIAVNVASSREERREYGEMVTIPGEAAVVFSLEMPRDQLAQRMLCTEARVDNRKLRNGRLQPADWNRLTEAAARLGPLPVIIEDTPALGLMEIRARVRRHQAMCARNGIKLGLVVIDYLQLMKGREDARSREEEIGEISRGLKQLAKELKVPVIVLSQLNREVEKRSAKTKRPQLSDLRESGAIEQDADNIIFITRREYYEEDDTPSDWKGIAEIDVAKQRNGATGRIYMRFDGSCTRFDNLAREDWPQTPWN
ncbi:replicative DNA helicase [Sorangium sp. So ce134]